MSKSFATNLIAAVLTLLGFVSPVGGEALLAVGLFALSGALTNWLAIYMLFERVPGLYGSGVIPARFEEFKQGIHDLVMSQFFTRDNLERFLEADEAAAHVDFAPIVANLDYDHIFAGLMGVIKESRFGGMLGMVGGDKALEPLREPFETKMSTMVLEITATDRFQRAMRENLVAGHATDALMAKVDQVVRLRLDELTPEMVKEIIQEMIRRHLGWLVVWGGVFGGLIGLLTSFVVRIR
jgi:uncharacterized membrane protein YheB (UPF0754 family)